MEKLCGLAKAGKQMPNKELDPVLADLAAKLEALSLFKDGVTSVDLKAVAGDAPDDELNRFLKIVIESRQTVSCLWLGVMRVHDLQLHGRFQHRALSKPGPTGARPR